MPNKLPKIHAYLARNTRYSRRTVEELIRKGVVTKNGEPAQIGERVNPKVDELRIDGELVAVRGKTITFLIYKPVGYVSTTRDERGRPTVLDLIPQQKERLYPVGRLDMDSQGLMLLTNDGELNLHLTHPRYQTPKTYRVTTTTKLSHDAFGHLKRGVKLKDGWAKPTELERDSDDETGRTILLTITEGRNHEVRRMLRRVGYDIAKLERTQIGPYSLSDLDGQSYRQIEM